MAFGKDNSQLANIPTHGSWSQQARAASKRPVRTGGGNRGYWTDKYQLAEYTPDIIRMIPGSYSVQVSFDAENISTMDLRYVPFREHHNGTRGCICSGGPLWANKTLHYPCPSCIIFWEDVAIRKQKKAVGDTTRGPNRMSCRDQFAFNVWDYGLYFDMPQLDAKSGQPRINTKTGQPYTEWVKGNAQDPKFQGRSYKYGHLMPWIIGNDYREVLLTRDEQIGLSCANCGSVGSIRCIVKRCGNPACREPIYDPNNSPYTPEQRKDIDNNPFLCPKCGQKEFIGEDIECSRCSSLAGQIARRATIYDVDMQVQMSGTRGQRTFLNILNHSEPRPIQVSPEILKTIGPLDLIAKFAPTPPEEQLKIMGLSYMAQPQQQQQQPMNQQMGQPMQQQMAPMPQQFQQPQMQPPMMQPPMQQMPMQQGFQQPQPGYPPQGQGFYQAPQQQQFQQPMPQYPPPLPQQFQQPPVQQPMQQLQPPPAVPYPQGGWQPPQR